MKSKNKINLLITTLLFCCLSTASFSQTFKEVVSDSETPMTYLGIDFSKARLLTSGDADEIRNKYYASINFLVINEPKKFEIQKAFHKTHYSTDLSAVSKKNDKANINDIISTNSADFYRLKETDINGMVRDMDLSGKQGVGLVFIMEAMRKIDKKAQAAIWATFVDMKSKKVLFTERIESKVAGGIGFRNYWASSIKNLIETIDKTKLKEWQSK